MFFDTQLLSGIQQSNQGKELQTAVKKLLQKIGVKKIEKVGSVPKTQKTLIISNHPGVFDTLLLVSQVERNDFHFVALSTYGVFGKAVREHLLPIYRQRTLKHKIYEYPLNLQIQGKIPEKLSVHEMRKKNRATIARAAELLNKNRAVSVFPTGSAGKPLPGSSWKPGIGYLVHQAYDPKMKIVFARISGTRKSDLAAYFKQPLRKILFKPRSIQIEFGDTYTLGELINRETPPKKVALQLEQKYNLEWKS